MKKSTVHPNKKERDKQERGMTGRLVDSARLRQSYVMVAAQCWVAIKYTMLQIIEGKT